MKPLGGIIQNVDTVVMVFGHVVARSLDPVTLGKGLVAILADEAIIAAATNRDPDDDEAEFKKTLRSLGCAGIRDFDRRSRLALFVDSGPDLILKPVRKAADGGWVRRPDDPEWVVPKDEPLTIGTTLLEALRMTSELTELEKRQYG